ncbi:hypothetical protein CHLNCDRAFT_135413 [Chlorella variabilis]|uniref:Uncharacterized protein n=1 Tax=Chlorella variabilis TaxID=554065 RepID=E1ZI63_CHLVA|nr:hypothetical protein CHLNCDRAFT_135413 [Chlorella variabilis]EFN54583.1 hypothetical protein CHLNCDRAFT_135413 [Chlorella variabilis]|eukprot:XP_005846685.1 hypothetical protein CHLNCDRAFT_135413 [Chlorella variabilis]
MAQGLALAHEASSDGSRSSRDRGDGMAQVGSAAPGGDAPGGYSACAKCFAPYGLTPKGTCAKCKVPGIAGWSCVKCDGPRQDVCQACDDWIGESLTGVYLTAKGRCKYCKDKNCDKCASKTGICRTCWRGYGVVKGACIKCRDKNCAICNRNAARCTECYIGYAPDKNGKCIRCKDKNCAVCLKTADKCTVCSGDYTPVNGRILMVDGDHRVANRDVAAGDELIYNYNYDKRVAPDWTVGMQQEEEGGRGPAKKTVLAGLAQGLALAHEASSSSSRDRGGSMAQVGSAAPGGASPVPTGSATAGPLDKGSLELHTPPPAPGSIAASPAVM